MSTICRSRDCDGMRIFRQTLTHHSDCAAVYTGAVSSCAERALWTSQMHAAARFYSINNSSDDYCTELFRFLWCQSSQVRCARRAHLRPVPRCTPLRSIPKPTRARSDGGARRDDRQNHRVIMAVRVGIARLNGRVDRSQQIAELIDEAREGATHFRRRKLVEMHGNDAPGALHHELHQERADRKPQGRAAKGPQRNDRKRQQGRR